MAVITNHKCTVFGGFGLFFMHYYTTEWSFNLLLSTCYDFLSRLYVVCAAFTKKPVGDNYINVRVKS
jgi:hypothetical protein